MQNVKAGDQHSHQFADKTFVFDPFQDNEGSYSCKCNDGFRGYGFECFDVDECADQPDVCNDVSNSEEGITTCINTIGSYYCECNRGWIMVRAALFVFLIKPCIDGKWL